MPGIDSISIDTIDSIEDCSKTILISESVCIDGHLTVIP